MYAWYCAIVNNSPDSIDRPARAAHVLGPYHWSMFAYISDVSFNGVELVLVGSDVRMLAMEVPMTGPASAIEEVDEAKVEEAVCSALRFFLFFVRWFFF